MTSRLGSQQRSTWLMLAPFLLGVGVLVLGPALVTAIYAFTEYDGFRPAHWVGFDVFRSLPGDPEFRASLAATGFFLLLAIPLRVGMGLLLALLVRGSGRLSRATRTAVYSPAVIPEPAIALVWLWIINPFYGPLAVVIRLAGGKPGPLLLDPWGARLTILALSCFALGEGFLVTLAAHRELPANLYDVAATEGAGPVACFRRVTLPLLAPTLGLLVARDVVASLQYSLVPTLLITRGGPLDATKTLPVLIYERGFQEFDLGGAAALSVLLLAIGLAVAGLQALLLRRWWRGAT